jgi:EF-P beta-lysylation protein EpmB
VSVVVKSGPPAEDVQPWSKALAEAIRDPDELLRRLELPESLREPARRAAQLFPVMVTTSYLARIRKGDPADPLLRQVLPLGAETEAVPGFSADAVGDRDARVAPGVLQKYAGRVLLVATGACAIHCRYCFRREYAYENEPRRMEDWQPALEHIAADESVHEVILSGGDPLMLSDARLEALLSRLAEIPHIRRLRFHSRLPIVLPDRVTLRLIEALTLKPWQAIMVVHANHPAELADDCRRGLRRLIQAGLPVLNQAVLLRGINDSADVLAELCEQLVDQGVMPYYLHQLDHVAGAAHFEVPDLTGLAIMDELRRRLPGYAVPRFVREIAGGLSKTAVPAAS